MPVSDTDMFFALTVLTLGGKIFAPWVWKTMIFFATGCVVRDVVLAVLGAR